ncbi:MAG: phosphodiesterase [Bacilli bacterium]|nr:phosphodiesterase [Bacilli bacterium]
MKILVCSDTHGRIKAAKRLMEVIDVEKPDKIMHLGDYLYNGPRNGVPEDYDPMGVATLFNAHKEKMIGVEGNCDSRIDHMVLEFDVPLRREETLLGHKFYLEHGDFLPNPNIVLKKGDVLVSGHTHLLLLEKEGDGVHLNPGSIGFPKGGNPASYAIIDEQGITIKNLDDMSPIESLDF